MIEGVEPGGEGGLLGLAVHEQYLYAYFTASADNRIERFEIDGEPGALSLGEPGQASPSGIAIAGGSIYIANLRGTLLREVPLDALDTAIDHHAGEYGRLRDAVVAPDGALWFLTNNTDGRGDPDAADDRIIAINPY